MVKGLRYIYGPVSSWRLGMSLGIDPISSKEKRCPFNCLYCQVGDRVLFTDKREVFVSTRGLINEIESLSFLKIDYITFSGRGEPTLAKNLGEMISQIKKIRNEKIAVITNSSLIFREDVQRDLSLADFVMAKLDASSKEIFVKINRSMPSIELDDILKGIRDFRDRYRGRLALQIMFIKENKDQARDLARIARRISPDEVQLNTPLRRCSIEPLSKKELDIIKGYFKGMNIISVYDPRKKQVESIDYD